MTSLSRWDPFAEMQRLTGQMFRAWGGAGEERAFAPAVDIYEDDDAIMVRAELPGVRPEDVRIDVENNILTISGHRKLEREDSREGYHRIEGAYGSFTRSFALPESVDPDKVDAEIDQGILEVSIAKRAEVSPKRIPIKAHAVDRPKPVPTAAGEPPVEKKGEGGGSTGVHVATGQRTEGQRTQNQ